MVHKFGPFIFYNSAFWIRCSDQACYILLGIVLGYVTLRNVIYCKTTSIQRNADFASRQRFANIDYHNFIFPLRAKQVGEFIEIRHKNISPTRILSTHECLSLCDSVANKPPIRAVWQQHAFTNGPY